MVHQDWKFFSWFIFKQSGNDSWFINTSNDKCCENGLFGWHGATRANVNIVGNDLFCPIIAPDTNACDDTFGDISKSFLSVFTFGGVFAGIAKELDMEYFIQLLHIMEQNLVLYLVFVKKRKKKDFLMLVYLYLVVTNDFLVFRKKYFIHYVNNLQVLLMVYFMIREKEYVVQILHISQQNLMVYLVVLEEDYLVHYLHFVLIYLLLYLVQQQLVILILFDVFSKDVRTPPGSPASDGVSYATVLTPDATPNDMFETIKTDSMAISICPLIFVEFLNWL